MMEITIKKDKRSEKISNPKAKKQALMDITNEEKINYIYKESLILKTKRLLRGY